jgi:hypothetical protein
MPIANTKQGAVYLHGVSLTAPFAFSVGYTTSGADTIWHGIYVNDIPIVEDVPPGRQGHLVGQDSVRWAALAAARSAVKGLSQASPFEKARLTAQAFASVTSFVDSARALSASDLVIYWHDDSRPLYVQYTPPLPSPHEQSKVYLQEARLFARCPVAGGSLIMSYGVMMVNASSTELLHAEIDAIKRGDNSPRHILTLPKIADEFKNPRPLPPARKE